LTRLQLSVLELSAVCRTLSLSLSLSIPNA